MPIRETEDQVDIEPILATLSKGAEASAELSVRIAALLINKVLPTIHDLGNEVKNLTAFQREVSESLTTMHDDVEQLVQGLARDRLRQAEQNNKTLKSIFWDVAKLVLAAIIGAVGARLLGKP